MLIINKAARDAARRAVRCLALAAGVGASVPRRPLEGRFAQSDLLEGLEGLSPTDVQYFVETRNLFDELPAGLLGDAVFPSEDHESLDFKYVKGAGRGGVGVMAGVSVHDAEAPLMPRRGADVVSGEIPKLSLKALLGEEDLIRLNSADTRIRSGAVREIYNDVAGTRRGVVARLEWLRMQAFFLGMATIDETTGNRGVKLTVDFRVPANHKQVNTGADLWSGDNADPLADLRAWRQVMLDDGKPAPSRVYSPTLVFERFMQYPKVRTAILGQNMNQAYVNIEQVQTWLQMNGFPRWFTYDFNVQYKNEQGRLTTIRGVPAGRLTLVSAAGPLGRTLRAPTATEFLRDRVPGIVVTDPARRISTKIYMSTQDPETVVTLSKASTFPSFEMADEVFQAVVM